MTWIILDISTSYDHKQYECVRVSSYEMLSDQQKELYVTKRETLIEALNYIEEHTIK